MRPHEIDYSLRKKFYFDTGNGEILESKQEKQSYIASGGDPDCVRPLADLLHDPDFDEVYPPLDVSQWPREKLEEYGKWIKALIKLPNGYSQQALNKPLLSRARQLGIGPGQNRIRTVFGTYSNFYVAVGSTESHIIGTFDEWSIDNFVNYLKRIGGTHKPTIEDLRAFGKRSPSNPMPEYMDVRFKEIGGLRALLELAGYAVIENWDKSDYVDWGVKFMEANDGLIPTSRMTDYLSNKKVGPVGASIRNKFGKMRAYQAHVSVEHEAEKSRKEEMKRLARTGIKSDFFNNQLPLTVFFASYEERGDEIVFQEPDATKDSDSVVSDLEEILGEKELLARYAKYLVVKTLFPAMKLERKLLILKDSADEDFIISIKRHVNHDVKVSSGEVEHTALILQAFDYIWPMDEHLQTLKLDDGYYKYIDSLEATARKRRLAKRAINSA